MGKRKAARKPQKKVKQVLDKKFLCIYCSHEDTVTVKLDFQNNLGHLACRACGVSYQAKIHALAEPVDVYSDWIDSAEEAQKRANERGGSEVDAEYEVDGERQPSSSRAPPRRIQEKDDDEDRARQDDDVESDGLFGESGDEDE